MNGKFPNEELKQISVLYEIFKEKDPIKYFEIVDASKGLDENDEDFELFLSDKIKDHIIELIKPYENRPLITLNKGKPNILINEESEERKFVKPEKISKNEENENNIKKTKIEMLQNQGIQQSKTNFDKDIIHKEKEIDKEDNNSNNNYYPRNTNQKKNFKKEEFNYETKKNKIEEEEKESEPNCLFKSAINCIKNLPPSKNVTKPDTDRDNKQDINYIPRKKFVPPKCIAGNYNSNSSANGAFDPAQSLVNITKSKPKADTKKNKDDEEKYKGLDKKLVDLIEMEILINDLKVNWNDIAGLDFAKKTIREIIVWPILRPDIFKGVRSPPKGLLLFGPQGTGKTMIGKAIASESKSTFFNISASSLTSKWFGEGEKMVRTLFEIARQRQPSVIFIDEIDSLLSSRSENEFDGCRRIKTEFLVQLDGAATCSDERLLVIGATNRPGDLDEALRRRLIKRLYIPLPNLEARKQYLENVLNHQIEHSLSLEEINNLASMTKKYSGADLKSLIVEASFMPLRSIENIENIEASEIRKITFQDFKESLLKVKPTVSIKDLNSYLEWNKEFGSFPIENSDIDN